MASVRARLTRFRSSGRKAALAIATLVAHGAVLSAAAVEDPNPLAAARYLAASELSGPEFKVAAEATTDGFATTYSVSSRFGTWTAQGRMQLAMRVREIQALASLEEVSKSKVFLDAVKSSATAPLQLVKSVAEEPVETLKGVPEGVGRWLKKTTFRVQEGYHDAKQLRAGESKPGEEGKPDLTQKGKEEAQKYALDYLKISGAELAWYAKLGVDPYTDNTVLREAVSSVARVQGLTDFGMKFVAMPSIPGAREAKKTMDLVWKTDPWELRLANRKKLLAAGLSEETARRFEDNAAVSLSLQTSLLQSLDELSGVGGRESVIARAIEVRSRQEAATLATSIALMAQYHQNQGGLAEFLPDTPLPVARTRKGELVALIFSDALFWTAKVDEAAREFAATYSGDQAKERHLWVVGEASPAFASAASGLGWKVHDRWQSGAAATPATAAKGGAGR
jgi:hypothetical protein